MSGLRKKSKHAGYTDIFARLKGTSPGRVLVFQLARVVGRPRAVMKEMDRVQFVTDVNEMKGQVATGG